MNFKKSRDQKIKKLSKSILKSKEIKVKLLYNNHLKKII